MKQIITYKIKKTLNNQRKNYYIFEKIEFDMLKEKGVKGVILDIDNTLVEPHTPVADERTVKFVEFLKNEGFKVCIVSNNIYERAKKFADSIPVDFICDGNKPAKKPFYLALGKLELEPKDVAVVGDQIFTDILGANRWGFVSVLVKPVCNKEGWFVKFKRIFERFIVKW